MHFNWFIPPLYSSKLPNAGAFFEWLSFFGTNLKKDFYRKYFTKRISKITFLEKIIKKHELNLKIFTNKVFHPSFHEVEEWFLAPDYFDYKQQKLFAWQRYAGFLIDMHRAEFVSNEVRTFLENINHSHSLIYFSLGVSYFAHLENPSQVFAHFVEIISKLSAQHSNFRFIAVVPKLYQPSTKNEATFWLEKAPQLTILKKANLFLTHGGMNSLLEAAYLAVPVVVFPLNDVWDQNGNAARIKYLGIGELADLKISYEKLQRLIIDILQNEEVKENCVKMSQRMKTNNLNIN